MYNENNRTGAATLSENAPVSTNSVNVVLDNQASTEKTADTPKVKKSRKGKPKNLQEMYEYGSKLIEQRNLSKKKTADYNKLIAENNAAIFEHETKEINNVCKARKFTIKELLEFLNKLPDGITLKEASDIILRRPQHQPFVKNGSYEQKHF